MLKKNINILLLATILIFPSIPFLYSIKSVIAHNVEISNDVAATFHIEPNHNPRVGKETQAWFALTRRGGKPIPLSECNCQLSVYAIPRTSDTQPILNPTLEAINVEKYQEIPGANLVFPKPGAYELEISGTPKDGNSFQPFQFTYTVNVLP